MPDTEHEKSSSKLQAGIILFCGTVAAMFWFVFSSSVFEQWWRKCSFLPDKLYYPVEEFLALHSHQNDPYTYGISFVIASFFAWLAHRLCRELKSWCRGVFFAFLILLLLALLFPSIPKFLIISMTLFSSKFSWPANLFNKNSFKFLRETLSKKVFWAISAFLGTSADFEESLFFKNFFDAIFKSSTPC